MANLNTCYFMESNHLDNQYYAAELKENILYVQYKPMVRINLENAKAIVAHRLAIFNNLQTPVLIKVDKIKSIDREARKFLFNEGLINLKAVALIEDHNQDKVLATFLLGLESPKVPCQSFDNEEEAVAWLRQYN